MLKFFCVVLYNDLNILQSLSSSLPTTNSPTSLLLFQQVSTENFILVTSYINLLVTHQVTILHLRSDDMFWLKQYVSPDLMLPFASHVRCSICRIVIAFPSCRDFPICDSGLRQGMLTGYSPTPVSCAGRVAYFTSHLCAIVLMAGYAGNYISFLSAGRPLVMPFTSVRGMLEDGSFRLGAIARSAQVNFFDVRGFRRTLYFNSSYFESHFFLRAGCFEYWPLCDLFFFPQSWNCSHEDVVSRISLNFRNTWGPFCKRFQKPVPKRCTGCMNSEREY